MGFASEKRYQWQWTWLSAALLLVYLGFFHACLDSSYLTCNLLGISCWLAWAGICYFWKEVFLNRFEFWIHQLVGVDILLEGFSPIHEGYGFYVCAICFWCVFLTYRFANRKVASDSVKPEFADSWSGGNA